MYKKAIFVDSSSNMITQKPDLSAHEAIKLRWANLTATAEAGRTVKLVL